jgi:predicted ATPase/DNA-binding SARP family transcriptional activator
MLEVRLLGQFEVLKDGRPLNISTRNAQLLFAFLVLKAGKAQRRERLAGLLWPESSEENARSNLRHELWRLRKALETESQSYFQVDDLTIAFQPQGETSVDVHALESLPPDTNQAEVLKEALSRYQGELLPGFYADWVLVERERLYALYEAKIARLLDILQSQGRWIEVIEWAQGWIGYGQLPEPAFQALIAAYANRADLSKAAMTYERFERALQRELGVKPSETTQALYQRIKAGWQPEVQARKPAHKSAPFSSRTESERSNLPQPISSFIGREKELQEVEGLLSHSRLVTLTGVGGTGKTRLALKVAAKLQNSYKDGVRIVELAQLLDPDLVPAMAAVDLGLREASGRPILETILDFLRARQLLVILDNCEHLIEACARFTDEVLRDCPGITFLVTSREALGITGEHIYPVPALGLPQFNEGFLIPELTQVESVRLFIERASAVQPSFALNDENAPAVVSICQRLDGLPLGIELAAARVKVMTPEMIANRLDDRFRLLTGGSRIALPRQQTLRASIDWSYNLLEEAERRLLRRLALFVGGCTLEAAQAVGGDGDPFQVIEALTSLVDKSLVRLRDTRTGPRYTLLETIRQYAGEKLLESGEMQAVRRRHLGYFMEWVEAAEPETRGPQQVSWLYRLEVERENLRLAFEFSLTEDPPAGLRLASALWWFWFAKNHLVEGERWLVRAVLKPENSARTIHLGRALGRLGMISGLKIWGRLVKNSNPGKNSVQASLNWAREGLEICQETNDEAGLGYAHFFLGWVYAYSLGDYTAARMHYDASAELFEKTGDSWGLARVQFNLSRMARHQGDIIAQVACMEKSLALCREIGDWRGIATALDNLGVAKAEIEGNLRAGRALVQEALDIYRQFELHTVVNAIIALSYMHCWQGDFQLARQVLDELVENERRSGNPLTIASAYLQMGDTCCLQGSFEAGIAILEQNLWAVKESGSNEFILILAYALACSGQTERAKQLLDENQHRVQEEPYLLVHYLRTRGWIALLGGAGSEACHYYCESLRNAKKIGNILEALLSLEGYAWALNSAARRSEAARIYGATADFRDHIGAPVFPLNRPMYERVMTELQNELGEAGYAQAWGEGKAMGLDRAIGLVLGED